jgi:uncharacterized membrane protein
MKAFFQNLKTTIIAGVIFLLPVFGVLMLLQKLYGKLTGFGSQMAALLGIKSVAGIGATSIATTLILVALFYVSGLMVKVTFMVKFRNWVESNLLQYIPGYLGYKVKMEEKLLPRIEARTAALVHAGEIMRPGFLVSRSAGKCVVFIPNTPDTNTGEVWVVDENKVQDLGKADDAFLNGIRYSGRGLRTAKAEQQSN